MELRNVVKEERQKRHITQIELSQLSGVGRSTISDIETGRYIPGVDVAICIARSLDRFVEELFFVEMKEKDG